MDAKSRDKIQVYACNLAIGKLKQEDCQKLEDNLTWTAQKD